MQCEQCGEREAEVEVEIPTPKNGTKVVHLCIECATEEHDGRAG